MVALVDNQPRLLNLKQMLRAFIEFRQTVVRRRCEFELRKAEARAHILEGLKIALDNLDAVISTIRESVTVEQAQGLLMSRFGLTAIRQRRSGRRWEEVKVEPPMHLLPAARLPVPISSGRLSPMI